MASNTRAREPWLDTASLLLRLALGVIFVFHGGQKVGLFGGEGLDAAIRGLQDNFGVPPFLGYVTILAELGGGLGLVFGFLTRLAGLGIFVVMIVAIAMVHGKNGLSMANGGFEYNLALAAMSLYFFLIGGGPYSLDARIWKSGRKG